MSIKAAIEEFTQRLHAILESQATERARAAVLNAFGVSAPKRRGRPPKAATSLAPVGKMATLITTMTKPITNPMTKSMTKKARKKMPPQFCPVPGCKNKAAPIFGMVCSKHKDVAKSKIKKYREARKAKKLKAAA
jgi:hypothetical protein